MSYDTNLFIQIIEDTPGIIFLRSDCKDDIHVRFYQGLKGNLVPIDTTDEEMYDSVVKGHLVKLGLEDLIQHLFPEQKLVVLDEQEEDIDSAEAAEE